MCNLGSVNMSRIKTIEEFADVCYHASQFLYAGSLKADLPFDKCVKVRQEHRKIGLGLMGVHEWLLQRGYDYTVVPELHKWMQVYEKESKRGADDRARVLNKSKCEKYRAIAPAGTISILAGTTSGIEPVFSVATKRRYLDKDQKWVEEYYIDPVIQLLMDQGVDVSGIDTAYSLSKDIKGIEKRIKFQADMQEYVDMGISSTVQLPPWNGTPADEVRVHRIRDLLLKYCTKLKGITFFPDGSRGGQPLTEVTIEEAMCHINKEPECTLDIAEAQANAGCKSGVCGL